MAQLPFNLFTRSSAKTVAGQPPPVKIALIDLTTLSRAGLRSVLTEPAGLSKIQHVKVK